MSRLKGRFTRPSSESLSEDGKSEMERPEVRRSTIYDAVAGQVTQNGFLAHSGTEKKRANQPLRPDEVLFKKINAPTRYEETDYYFAHRALPLNQRLPDGDLLAALHAYVSTLYERTQAPGQKRIWKCMDETALIALGILMEETAKETLGETGDLALVEAAKTEEEETEKASLRQEKGNQRPEAQLVGYSTSDYVDSDEDMSRDSEDGSD